MNSKQFENELTDNILNYWTKRVYDPKQERFLGYIGPDEQADPDAPLGVVLVSRILWTFSSVYALYPTAIYRKMADEAYRTLTELFWDNGNGGVYWLVKPEGEPSDSSKQFYGQAFALYAFAEYARIFNHAPSRQLAVSLFHLIEGYGFDSQFGGYFEAMTTDWSAKSADYITPKGDRMNKSMNTHLHILEAYTNLYRVSPEDDLKDKIAGLLEIFTTKIINPANHHFHMFFDYDWSVQSTAISYGHDIEGSWLLWEAAEVLGDRHLAESLKPLVIRMAEAVAEQAVDPEGGLYNESDQDHWDKNFHWWPQSEAVVGFYNAWQLTGNEQFRAKAEKAWSFIRKYQVDQVNGEWFGWITPQYTVRPMARVSAWKCPYHNGRMCMEMIRRMKE